MGDGKAVERREGDRAQGGRWHLIRAAESEGWTLEVEGRTQQVAGMQVGVPVYSGCL